MSSWLYPISERSDLTFLLNDGTRVKVSVEEYQELVENRRLAEYDWWYINQNFNKVDIGDELYIYTGDEDSGIIGYAIVKDKRGQDRDDWELYVNIDLDKCRMLIQNPIPAQAVRPWVLPSRIKTVNNFDSVQSELEDLLPW